MSDITSPPTFKKSGKTVAILNIVVKKLSKERRKTEAIRAMLPDLDENPATKGVARKLRSILNE